MNTRFDSFIKKNDEVNHNINSLTNELDFLNNSQKGNKNNWDINLFKSTEYKNEEDSVKKTKV